MTHRPYGTRSATPRHFPAYCLATVMLFACVISAGAQVSVTSPRDGSTPAALAPGAPAGSYAVSNFENINMYSGNLNFRLPLLSVGGRGGSGYTIMLAVEQHWHTDYWQDNEYGAYNFVPVDRDDEQDFKPGYSPGVVLVKQVSGQDMVCNPQFPLPRHYDITLTRVIFKAPDGTQYEFRDVLTDGQVQKHTCANSGGKPRGRVWVTKDGSMTTFISDSEMGDDTSVSSGFYRPNGYIMFRNGTRYRIEQGRVMWIRDRNGNMTSLTYNKPLEYPDSKVASITDSLNRKVTFCYAENQSCPGGANYDQISFNGFGGTARTIRVHYGNLSGSLRSGYTPKSPKALFPSLDGDSHYNYETRKVSSVELPDANRSYSLLYNPYGEVARVVLPMGGAYEYDYSPPEASVLGDGNRNIYRRLTKRRVYPDGATGPAFEAETVYEDSYVTSPAPITTVVAKHSKPVSKGGQMVSFEKHHFYGDTRASFSQNPAAHPQWDEGREFKTEVLDPVTQTPLRLTEHEWRQREPVSWWTYNPHPVQCLPQCVEPANDPRVIETRTTLVDTGQVAKRTFSFDPAVPYNLQTDVYEYALKTSGSDVLLRHTHTEYLKDAGYVHHDVHLRGLPLETWVTTDGDNDNKRSHVIYEYDNYAADARHAPLKDREKISGLCTYFPSNVCAPSDSPNHVDANYLTRGNVTGTTRVLLSNAGAAIASLSVNQQYDVAGNVVRMIDGEGASMDVEFDDNFGTPDGDARNKTAPGELASKAQFGFAFATKTKNELGHESHSQYDYHLGKPVDTEDTNGVVMSAYYNDLLDRPKKMIDNAGGGNKNQTTFNYDDSGRMTTVTADQERYEDNLIKTAMVYDGLGRVVETRQYETGDDYIATRQAYDAMGRVAEESNPLRPGLQESAVWTKTEFDGLGRTAGTTMPDLAKSINAYKGNVTMVTDPAGRTRRSETDALGRVVEVVEFNRVVPDPTVVQEPIATDFVTTYTYDVSNNLRKVKHGEQERYFSYDSLGRLLRAKHVEQATNADLALTAPDPVTGHNQWSVSYAYDANDNITQKTDARGRSVTFEYDVLNRVEKRLYADTTPDVFYTYDEVRVAGSKAVGRLTTARSSESVTHYDKYDEHGQVVQSSQVTGTHPAFVMRYGYNLAGQLTSQVYPSGRTVTSGFDRANRLSGVTGEDGRNYASSIEYAAHGNVKALKLGNNLWEHTAYNLRYQPEEVGVGASALDSSTLKITYAYGLVVSGALDKKKNNGSVQSQTITMPGLTLEQSYTYDALNRLTEAVEKHGAAQSWKQVRDYDRFGNRNFAAGTTLPGQLTALNNPTVSTATNRFNDGQGYLYDEAGNVTEAPTVNPQVSHNFSYDAENRLTDFEGGAGNGGVTYGYDGDGQRVRKTVGLSTTFYVYNVMGQLMAEYGSAPPSAGGTSYLSSDALGTPRVITGAGGAVLARHDYQPFGEELPVGVGGRGEPTKYVYGLGDDGVRQKFTGKERDVETGLDYFYARHYSSLSGRFMSVDPYDPLTQPGGLETYLTQPQNWNRYTYGLNNPLKYIDPDGENPLLAAAAAGAALGALAGGGLELVKQLASGKSLKEVNWRKVGAAAAGGAVVGAVAGMTGGLSLLSASGAMAGASVLGGVVDRGLDGDPTTGAFDKSEMTIDLVAGFAGGVIGHRALKYARKYVPGFIMRRRAVALDQWEVLLGTPLEIPTIQGRALKHALGTFTDSRLWEKPMRGGAMAATRGSTGAALRYLERWFDSHNRILHNVHNITVTVIVTKDDPLYPKLLPILKR